MRGPDLLFSIRTAARRSVDLTNCCSAAVADACACTRDAPGARRPIGVSQYVSVLFSTDGLASISGWKDKGTQKSGGRRTRSPKNSGGVTPTIVKAVLLRTTARPMTEGSAFRRRCQ